MFKGKVKWFNNQKGYGFITDSEGRGDIFVHYTGILKDGYKSLKDGQLVEYEIIDVERGLQAVNVEVINEEDKQMSNKLRTEWEQYVFEAGKDYTFEEAIGKVSNALKHLKDMGVRVTEDMLLNNEKFEIDFHLLDEEKERYIQMFNGQGYAVKDCTTIVKVMDAMYHMFDVTTDEAYEMASYAADNHLTLTQTIKDKLKVDIDEVEEFINIVLSNILEFFKGKSIEVGKELSELIADMLASLE